MENIKSNANTKNAKANSNNDDIVMISNSPIKPELRPLKVEVLNFPAPPKRSIKFRFPRLKTPLFGILALLLARHFVPEVGEALAPVYQALDTIVIPIINGVYEVSLTLLEKLGVNAESIGEVFSKVVEWISTL